MNRRGERPLQKKIEFTSWIVFGFVLFLSGVFASAGFTLGVLTGGLISILNFYGMRRGLKSAFGKLESGGTGKSLVMFNYLSRLVVTGFVLYFVLVKTNADIFGLVIGLSTVVIGIFFSVIMTVFDKSYIEEV
jgi:hypothetical protein